MLILGIILVIGAPAWFLVIGTGSSPTEKYAFTIPDQEAHFRDGQQVRYQFDWIPSSGWGASEVAIYLKRCDPAELAKAGVSIIGRVYRDVELCNAAGLGQDALASMTTLFEEDVDNLYRDHAFALAGLVARGLLLAVLVWFGVLALVLMVRWIMSGDQRA